MEKISKKIHNFNIGVSPISNIVSGMAEPSKLVAGDFSMSEVSSRL